MEHDAKNDMKSDAKADAKTISITIELQSELKYAEMKVDIKSYQILRRAAKPARGQVWPWALEVCKAQVRTFKV
jgi:hypothetical protein